MDQIKQIIKAYSKGKGIKAISKHFGISKNTVRKYIKRCKDAHVPIEVLIEMQDEELRRIMYLESSRSEASRVKVFEESLSYWISELPRVGVTRQLLWEEYRVAHPDGFGYSQFCDRLKRDIGQGELTMHLNHRPAHQLMLDFAGKKMRWIDLETGEVHDVHILIGVLPFSHYTFAIALPSQQIQDFVHGINQALLFFGGCPETILSDNLASFVKKANRYEPKFTDLCVQLAAHYHIDLSATRARKPKDKASVENMVSTVYTRIYAPLRDQEFFSLAALNEAIQEQVKIHNNKHFQKKSGSRQSIFEEYEKPLLSTLPTDIFEIKKHIKAKVSKNYHLELGEDRAYYSVHYKHVGKRVDVIYTDKLVEIFDLGARIAVHSRMDKHGQKYSTFKEHMPDKHKMHEQLNGYTGAEFTVLAKNIGQTTEWAIRRILRSAIHEQQTYRSCLGVLSLARKYGHERLEAACKRCQIVDKVCYSMLKRILEKNLDQCDPDLFTTTRPDHENLRGPNEYV